MGTGDEYRTALASAIKEYEDLGQRRREIDDRLAQLAQTIGTLNRLLGLTPTVPLGLTDACRLAVRAAGLPLTPLEVRDRLLAMGFNLSVYTSELSAIHTVLRRLNEAGEIRFVPRAGKHAYIWNHPPATVVVGHDTAASIRHDSPPTPRDAIPVTKGGLRVTRSSRAARPARPTDPVRGVPGARKPTSGRGRK
jgi:hypothetical protein